MLFIVIAENSPDSVPASHAEVLAAVQDSGLHVENIVKTIMTADIMGAYLQTVPPLQPYEIKKKEDKVESVESKKTIDLSILSLVNVAVVAAASTFVTVLLLRHHCK